MAATVNNDSNLNRVLAGLKSEAELLSHITPPIVKEIMRGSHSYDALVAFCQTKYAKAEAIPLRVATLFFAMGVNRQLTVKVDGLENPNFLPLSASFHSKLRVAGMDTDLQTLIESTIQPFDEKTQSLKAFMVKLAMRLLVIGDNYLGKAKEQISQIPLNTSPALIAQITNAQSVEEFSHIILSHLEQDYSVLDNLSLDDLFLWAEFEVASPFIKRYFSSINGIKRLLHIAKYESFRFKKNKHLSNVFVSFLRSAIGKAFLNSMEPLDLFSLVKSNNSDINECIKEFLSSSIGNNFLNTMTSHELSLFVRLSSFRNTVFQYLDMRNDKLQILEFSKAVYENSSSIDMSTSRGEKLSASPDEVKFDERPRSRARYA